MIKTEQLKSNYFATVSLCPICNSKNIPAIMETDYKKHTFQILTCQDCHVSFTSPQIKKDFLPQLYDGPSDGIAIAKSKFLKKLRNIKLTWLYVQMQKSYAIDSTKSILDYGCGDGLFTKLLKKNCANAIGVDFSLSPEHLEDDTLFYPIHASELLKTI
jgi:hypothetical protein